MFKSILGALVEPVASVFKAKEERKKALATLQTSADDIVTEMRRKPLGARNNGRRATLCTITPNLQELYGEDRYRPSPLMKRMVKEQKSLFADVV